MNMLKSFFQGKLVYVVVVLVALVAIGIFVSGGNGNGLDTLVVTRGNFVSQVSVSGKVLQDSDASLGFASSGRVGKIFVQENDVVRAGQTLAQLEIGDLLAELKIKQSSYKTSDTDLESDVINAYRTLLSEGLILVPDSEDYDMEYPDITGIYKGEEGQYKIIISRRDVTSSDFYLSTFGLEKTKVLINSNSPTPIGTKGLYLNFDGLNLEDYDDTIWYLDIPNKASSEYVTNYNTYQKAKNRFDASLKGVSEDSSSAIAKAEIEKINAEIRKNTIYAPFSGVITSVTKDAGETANTNEAIVSMIGTDIFQIEVFVPEVNVAQIALDQQARVTLDAYGPDVLFDAIIFAIDPGETVRDGVSTYKTKLKFSEFDDRIRSGMTANVNIITFEKPDALTVPSGVVFEKEGVKYVQIKNINGIEDREVTTGLVSASGQVEILSGISEGDEVLLNPKYD